VRLFAGEEPSEDNNEDVVVEVVVEESVLVESDCAKASTA
jgi:hypothetical protein